MSRAGILKAFWTIDLKVIYSKNSRVETRMIPLVDRPVEVVAAHQPTSKVMLCAREPSATGHWLRSTPSVFQ